MWITKLLGNDCCNLLFEDVDLSMAPHLHLRWKETSGDSMFSDIFVLLSVSAKKLNNGLPDSDVCNIAVGHSSAIAVAGKPGSFAE